MKTTKRKTLQSGTQTWVEVTTGREGTIIVEPYDPLYTNHLFRADTGIADGHRDEPFHILLDNFIDHKIALLPQQVVAYSSEHHETLTESHISDGEILDIMHED